MNETICVPVWVIVAWLVSTAFGLGIAWINGDIHGMRWATNQFVEALKLRIRV